MSLLNLQYLRVSLTQEGCLLKVLIPKQCNRFGHGPIKPHLSNRSPPTPRPIHLSSSIFPITPKLSTSNSPPQSPCSVPVYPATLFSSLKAASGLVLLPGVSFSLTTGFRTSIKTKNEGINMVVGMEFDWDDETMKSSTIDSTPGLS